MKNRTLNLLIVLNLILIISFIFLQARFGIDNSKKQVDCFDEYHNKIIGLVCEEENELTPFGLINGFLIRLLIGTILLLGFYRIMVGGDE